MILRVLGLKNVVCSTCRMDNVCRRSTSTVRCWACGSVMPPDIVVTIQVDTSGLDEALQRASSALRSSTMRCAEATERMTEVAQSTSAAMDEFASVITRPGGLPNQIYTFCPRHASAHGDRGRQVIGVADELWLRYPDEWQLQCIDCLFEDRIWNL